MNNNERIAITVWSVLILLLLSLYVCIYCRLNSGLQSIFDEGFFFLQFYPIDSYTVSTRTLSLGSELLQAVFPSIGSWDVLSLRRLAFGVKDLGISFLLFSSCYFLRKDRKEKSIYSYLIMTACILLFGLFVMPSVAVNMNDELLFLEMVVLSFCLLAASSSKNATWLVFVGMVGLFSLLATLCNAPGGVMLGFLSFLFLILYNGYSKKKLYKTLLGMLVGVAIGLIATHCFVITLPDAVAFIKTAVAQTTNGTSASHHSLTRLAVLLLLNIRDLVLSLTMLCGITFLCQLLQRRVGKKWLTVVIGITLFVMMYKWQVKPEIKFASIMTWFVLMSWMVYRGLKKEENCWNDDLILVLFLYLTPLAVSIGSNVGFLNKATAFIMPWGLLLFVLSRLTHNANKLFSNGLLIFVFVFVLYGRIMGMFHEKISNTAAFTKEYPIARMQLNKNQYAFYDEVHGILEEYGYKSKQDTILGFCFNEMTIVAMDAVPYTNDQLPEEFLLHEKDKLFKPMFMILSEWDEKVLLSNFETLDWDFPSSYDVIKLRNNPDPNSGWGMTQSSLYCVKSRKMISEIAYENN